jgi:hypothetical protein
MTAIFDMLTPARAAGFVRANGLLGFEARQFGPRDFRVVEHRLAPWERTETAYPAPSQVEACLAARRWAQITDTEVLAIGAARIQMAELAEAIRPMRPAKPVVQAVFSFGEVAA